VNDLDLVRSMRADAPDPSRERLDTGRERLLDAVRPSRDERPVRAHRLRGVLLVGGVAAVTAGVAVTVQVGLRPAEPGAGPATPAAESSKAESAKYDDVIVERASFGWLPRGLRPYCFIADRQERDRPFFQIAAEASNAGPSVALTAYRSGKEPFLGFAPGGVPLKRIPAEPVNGDRAYWLYKPNQSKKLSFQLRWEYAPNSWADLEATGLRGTTAELTGIAYRIAESVKFGGTRPVPMPLHVDGVPGGLTPNRVVLNKGAAGGTNAMLIFIVNGPSASLDVSVTKSTGATGTGAPEFPAPNTTLGRYRAYQAPGRLYAYDVNGFDVSIQATGSVLAKLNKTGGIAGLFRRTTVYGLDESKWTTNPVN
jgi:hypothetical protein